MQKSTAEGCECFELWRQVENTISLLMLVRLTIRTNAQYLFGKMQNIFSYE